LNVPNPEGKRSRTTRGAVAVLTAATLASVLVAPASAATSTATGPSTVTAPYVLPVADGTHIKSLLTVGDAGSASNGYEMVGIPDGLGVRRQGANLVLYMNQELRDTQGIVRRHGQAGAYVSRYVIDPDTLRIKEGSDWINPGVQYWDYPTGTTVTTGARFADGAAQNPTFGRFCSGTLSDPGVFYNESTKNGWKDQIYFANEENGDNGRAFGITKEGDATALPRLGLFSWENTIPASNQSDTTLVIGQEDGSAAGSQLWAYVGTKQDSGTPLAKAGLTNGDDHVLDAVNQAVTNDAQWRATYPKGVPGAVRIVANDWNQTGAAQNAEAVADGLGLNRIEDGHFDPSNPNDFYFLTTEGGQNNGQPSGGPFYRDGGGLWRLSWVDIENPDLGATLTLLLDGSEDLDGDPNVVNDDAKLHKPDNMVIDTHGNLLIQEDPGNVNHIARIVAYRISDGAMGVVAGFDADLFSAGATADPTKLTIDEESSGIIDTEEHLGAGTFIFDAQVHTAKRLPAGTGPGTAQEFVENGQLLTLKVDNWASVYNLFPA
jgi:hypothetical protein